MRKSKILLRQLESSMGRSSSSKSFLRRDIWAEIHPETRSFTTLQPHIMGTMGVTTSLIFLFANEGKPPFIISSKYCFTWPLQVVEHLIRDDQRTEHPSTCFQKLEPWKAVLKHSWKYSASGRSFERRHYLIWCTSHVYLATLVTNPDDPRGPGLLLYTVQGGDKTLTIPSEDKTKKTSTNKMFF